MREERVSAQFRLEEKGCVYTNFAQIRLQLYGTKFSRSTAVDLLNLLLWVEFEPFRMRFRMLPVDLNLE